MIKMFPALSRFRDQDVEEATRSTGHADGCDMIAGAIGRIAFIVSRDHRSGQIEASVSTPHGRATASHVAALCRHMNVAPPAKATRIDHGGLMWIVRPGYDA